MHDGAVGGVHQPGAPDADAVDVREVTAGAPDHLADRARRAGHDALRSAHRRQPQRLARDPVGAEEGREHLGAADVEAHRAARAHGTAP